MNTKTTQEAIKQIKEFLKENLTIELSVERDSTWLRVVVSLTLCGEKISADSDSVFIAEE